MLTCTICGQEFERPGSRGPVPRFCSQRCVTKSKRTPARIAWERNYRRMRRAMGLDLTDNVARRGYFRERWRRLFGDRHHDLILPNPYTGHRWFDMARQAVNGGRDIAPEFRDYGYNDEVGEAVLALLEGRDMDEAVKEFRRREFIPRRMTVHMGEWQNDEDDWKPDALLPSTPSAEDEVVAKETVVSYFTPARYSAGKNRRRFGNNRGRQQPHRRRMQDASLRSHRRAA